MQNLWGDKGDPAMGSQGKYA